jgi:hypothetical protein
MPGIKGILMGANGQKELRELRGAPSLSLKVPAKSFLCLFFSPSHLVSPPNLPLPPAGKAMECVGLIGKAVGAEKFGPDAVEILNVLFTVQSGGLDADDPQYQYMVIIVQKYSNNTPITLLSHFNNTSITLQ